MSWFDEQPQPQSGIWNPTAPKWNANTGQFDPSPLAGGLRDTTTGKISHPGGPVPGFLPGDQMGSDGLPGGVVAGEWPQPKPMTMPEMQTQPGTQAGPANGDWQSWFNQLVAGKPFNQQTLLELEPTLNAAGVQLTPPNAAGDRTKINVPGVGWVRVGFGEGRPVWNVQDGGSGTIGSLAGGGGMADGSLIQPWTEQFQAPSPEQIAQDPSYQFQLGEGLKGIERGAASKGTLLTGGTLKSLNQFGQGLASTFNDKYYNRALGEYGLRKDNFQQNQDRPFTKLSQLATLGKPQTMQPPTG